MRFLYFSKMEGFIVVVLFCLKLDVICDFGFFKICWGVIVVVVYLFKVFVYLFNWFKKCEIFFLGEWF